MKNCKKLFLYIGLFFFVQSSHDTHAGHDAAGVKMADKFTSGLKEALKENLPEVTAAAVGLGYNFGLGTTTAIGAGITKATLAVKAAAIAAAPPVAIGACVAGAAYLGYRAYRYFKPTKEDITQDMEHKTTESENELKKCLKEKMASERDHNGVPISCGEHACTHAIYAGAERTDKVVGDFARYAPSR